MTSSLKIDVLGASTAIVSWDTTSDGSVYTVHLQDSDGNTLTSIETQETSATFQDLTPSTKYVFQLYAVQPNTISGEYTKIRIDHPAEFWLSIQEVQVYTWPDETLMPSTSFNMTSSTPLNPGLPAQAMNGTIATSWGTGAMLDYRTTSGNNFWEASLLNPTQLSKLRLHTNGSWNLGPDDTLTMTKLNGEKEVYDLEMLTYQEISFPTPGAITTAVSPTVSAAPNIKYKSIRFQGDYIRYITLVELAVFNGSGVHLSSSNFTFESTSALSTSYDAKQAMNGNVDTSTYRSGATIRPGTSSTANYWQANYAGGTEISEIVIYYWSNSNYLGYLGESQLILTDVNNNETTFDLEAVEIQTITI